YFPFSVGTRALSLLNQVSSSFYGFPLMHFSAINSLYDNTCHMALYPLASVCKEPGGTYLKARVHSLTPFSLRELIPLQAQQTHQVYYAGLCSLKQRINCHVVIDSTVLQSTVVDHASKHE